MSTPFDLADQACLTLFGVPAILTSALTGIQYPITGIIQEPALDSAYLPGSQTGTNVIRFFTHLGDPDNLLTPLTPLAYQPKAGDTLLLNGTTYNIFDPVVDVVGGATLKLRRA